MKKERNEGDRLYGFAQSHFIGQYATSGTEKKRSSKNKIP